MNSDFGRFMVWRSTDRFYLCSLFNLPIDQDRDQSQLDYDMNRISNDDALYNTQYEAIAQDLIDECLTLKEALDVSLADVGVTRIDIDGQLAVTQTASAQYQQANVKYAGKLSELARIFGYPLPGRSTVRT